jgi:hypothetical protein
MTGSRIQVNAVAFKQGDAWVIQGTEYDIVAHAWDVLKVPHAFAQAVMENIIITKHLGREALDGIKPAPARFREMFKQADTEMRPATRAEDDPDVAVRLKAA